MLLLPASPVDASREGAAIGEGIAVAFRLGIKALVVSLAIGIALGLLVAWWKKLAFVRVVLLFIVATLFADAALVAGWFFLIQGRTEADVAHQRELQPFRDKSRAIIDRLQPGQVPPAIAGLMDGVPAPERSEKSLIIASDLSERMMWHPRGWTGADTSALAGFANAAFTDDVLAANFTGHAIAIDWLNGRQDLRIACTGHWASTCLRSIADGLSTACARQRDAASLIPACSPDMLGKADERIALSKQALPPAP